MCTGLQVPYFELKKTLKFGRHMSKLCQITPNKILFRLSTSTNQLLSLDQGFRLAYSSPD